MAFKQDIKLSFDPIKRAISIHFGKDDLTPMSKPSTVIKHIILNLLTGMGDQC